MTVDPSACLKVRLLTQHGHQQHRRHAIFLLVDGTVDSQHRDGEDGIDGPTAAPMANNVVIIISVIFQYSTITF